MLERITRLFSPSRREAMIQDHLERLRPRLPVPVFWLFGKTQSGKTTLIKFLTGAEEAEIGRGFQPCTRFSRRYSFPTEEAPLAVFLDTRGLDEPGYDPAEDVANFDSAAHVVVVTVRATDHAHENLCNQLRAVRRARPTRPVVLVQTCLHEAYPQQQHPLPYPFTGGPDLLPTDKPVPDDLLRSLAEQREHFAGLFDRAVPVDITPPEEGFNDPQYGGAALRQALFDALPGGLAESLRTLQEATQGLQDLYLAHALPHIYAYASLAATAGAVPVPIVDLLLLSAVQTRMVYHLAQLYGQPLTGERFLEIAGTLGTGMLVRQAGRGLIKLIPGLGSVLGSVAAGALAGASTYALGRAFCYYYQAVHKGHVPRADDLRRYYKEQFAAAERMWTRIAEHRAQPGAAGNGK